MLPQPDASTKPKQTRKDDFAGGLVKIGNQFWTFRSIPGRQFVKQDGESSYREYAVVRDNAERTISVSGSMPLADQLAEAAREVLLIQQDLEAAGKAVAQ